MMQKSPIQAFLFLGENSMTSYLKLFLEDNSRLYSSVVIVTILESITEHEIINYSSKITYINIPKILPDLSDIKDSKVIAFGNRVVDSLVLCGYLNQLNKQAFMFNNLELHSIMSALKKRFNFPLVLIIDRFKWDYLPQKSKLDLKSLMLSAKVPSVSLKRLHNKIEEECIKLSNKVLLETDEAVNLFKILYSDYADKYLKWSCPIKSYNNSIGVEENTKGILSVDNKKCIFIYSEGFTTKDYKVVIDSILDKVNSRFIILGELSTSTLPSDLRIREAIVVTGNINHRHALNISRSSDIVVIKEGRDLDKKAIADYMVHEIPLLILDNNESKKSFESKLDKFISKDGVTKSYYIKNLEFGNSPDISEYNKYSYRKALLTLNSILYSYLN